MGRIISVQPADENNQVVTARDDSSSYRRKPCPKCPWRVDAAGEFPAEAFRHSAATSYDMSEATFNCHESGIEKPATCAGFLLRGADNNFAVRIGYATGRFQDDVHDGGHLLHENYRAMAIANGVDPDDPALASCRN